MIFYLLSFLSCFYIEYLKAKDNKFYLVFVFFLFVFLCFGYMTGSDWRNYELLYDSNSYEKYDSLGEVGFGIVSGFFRRFISDFWVYNALMKCFHLLSLILVISCFSPKTYYAIALGFADSLLFMLIDCPMRFMMALTCLYMAIFFFFQKKIIEKFLAVFLIVASLFIHRSILAVLTMIILVIVFKPMSKVPRWVMISSFLIILFIAARTNISELIFSSVDTLIGDGAYANYQEFNNRGFLTMGTIRLFIILLIIMYYKNMIIESSKFGVYVYDFSCLAILFAPLAMCIPTMFRVNILNGIFLTIALSIILNSKCRDGIFTLSVAFVIISSIYILGRDCLSSYAYTPYSNSIPYILSGEHLPYPYRDNYNFLNHDPNIWWR